jgi:hypothetical protein
MKARLSFAPSGAPPQQRQIGMALDDREDASAQISAVATTSVVHPPHLRPRPCRCIAASFRVGPRSALPATPIQGSGLGSISAVSGMIRSNVFITSSANNTSMKQVLTPARSPWRRDCEASQQPCIPSVVQSQLNATLGGSIETSNRWRRENGRHSACSGKVDAGSPTRTCAN